MKTKKIIATVLCGVMLCSCFAGCGGTSGSGSSKKTIKYNLLGQTMSLTNVTFYDFYSSKKINSYTGKGTNATLSSTDIFFLDKNGDARIAKVDKKITSKPDKVKVYTSANKKSYDTYKCEY